MLASASTRCISCVIFARVVMRSCSSPVSRTTLRATFSSWLVVRGKRVRVRLHDEEAVLALGFLVRGVRGLRDSSPCVSIAVVLGGRRRSRGREGSKGGVDEAQAPHLPVVLGLRCWMRFPLSGHNVLDDTGRLSPLIYLHVGAV